MPSSRKQAGSPGTRLLREVETGPAGRRIGAFFDLDRTLIATFSGLSFVRRLVQSRRLSLVDLARVARATSGLQTGRRNFSSVMAAFAGGLAGMREDEFRQLGDRIFAKSLASQVFPESRALVDAHLRKGHRAVIVTSALPYQAEPLARDLGFDDVLCTRLEIVDGVLTGKVQPPVCFGSGKARALRTWAAEHDVDPAESYFYADSIDDLPAFEAVGRPRPINPDGNLRRVAARRGWPSAHFHSRGVPRLRDVARTAALVGSTVPSLAVGLPAAVASGELRRAFDVASAVWGELGCAIAGIEVRVQGEHHLWSQRPAVFVFNHTSAIEMLLLCRLLRTHFAGVAKQEIRGYPVVGRLFAMAGTVFIDREHREKAIASLGEAVDALRQGTSIIVAPEGTRMPSKRLGSFKKGAFQIAMQAGVPLVPIVFRNALDALPRSGFVVRPTTVDVVVHPPVSTVGWSRASLDGEVAKMEQLFRRTLEQA